MKMVTVVLSEGAVPIRKGMLPNAGLMFYFGGGL